MVQANHTSMQKNSLSRQSPYLIRIDPIHAVMEPVLDITVTIHRVSVLDLSSLTAQTIPVTGNPFNINRAFWPRYWA